MSEEIRELLRIPTFRLDDMKDVLLDPNVTVVEDFLKVVAKYISPTIDVTNWWRLRGTWPTFLQNTKTLIQRLTKPESIPPTSLITSGTSQKSSNQEIGII